MFKIFYGFTCVKSVQMIVDEILPPERYELTKCVPQAMDDTRVIVTIFYKERIH